MFDEIVLNLNLGCKVLPGHLVVGKFGQDYSNSVVVISQTLDKLVVHDISLVKGSQTAAAAGQASSSSSSLFLQATGGSSSRGKIGLDNDDRTDDYNVGNDYDKDKDNKELGRLSLASASPTLDPPDDWSPKISYITIKDVIRSISVRSVSHVSLPQSPVVPTTAQATGGQLARSSTQAAGNRTIGGSSSDWNTDTGHYSAASSSEVVGNTFHRDFLLVGCSNSLLICDAQNQANLLSIQTSARINAITGEPLINGSWPIVCAGPQKLYAIKFDTDSSSSNRSPALNAELSSERSTSDSISCLAQGNLSGLWLILTGCLESKIRAHRLDPIEQNISPCCLTIEESGPINCLCPINTLAADLPESQNTTAHQSGAISDINKQDTASSMGEQMNYFALGLDNGLIGVYRLFLRQPQQTGNQQQVAQSADGQLLASERLWRHKCKQQPMTMLMYDINGDGLDELVIGYKNSRLEARSPFTGQLLATTRCFKSDRLVGLTAVIDTDRSHNNGDPSQSSMLVACSAGGQLLGFKRPPLSGPKRALQGYLLAQPSAAGSDIINGPLDSVAEIPLDWISPASALDQNQSQSSGGNCVTNRKTIEEDGGDIFMSKGASMDSTQLTNTLLSIGGQKDASDLHIESQSDETKAGKCLARQNHELLLQLSALQNEQMELERRACHIYHRNLYNSNNSSEELYPSSASQATTLNVGHRWDFDSVQFSLRLTIVIATSFNDEVKLIELEDSSENFHPIKGFVLVQPSQSTANESGEKSEEKGRGGKSHLVVIPLTTKRDIECRLLLKVFYLQSASNTKRQWPNNDNNNSDSTAQQARVLEYSIEVPKFAMLTFADFAESKDFDSGDTGKDRTKMVFRLKDNSQVVELIDWLNRSLLCFQFGRFLIEDPALSSAAAFAMDQAGGGSDEIGNLLADTNAESGFQESGSKLKQLIALSSLMSDDTESFELNLLDLRRYLLTKKQSQASKSNELDTGTSKDSSQQLDLPVGCGLRVAGCKDDAGRLLLTLEGDSSDLVVALVQSLVIDRLHLEFPLPADGLEDAGSFRVEDEQRLSALVEVNIEPILNELNKLSQISRELEESERRIQTELYESADYTKNLMQQFGIANELNEFSIAKELLNELFMMLSGVQNSAKAQFINNRSRSQILKQVNELKEKVKFLTGNFDQ